MAVLHEAQQGSVQVGPKGILVLPSVQHRQKPPEEVQRCCWDLPTCKLDFFSCQEHQCMHPRQHSVKSTEGRGQSKFTVNVAGKNERLFLH